MTLEPHRRARQLRAAFVMEQALGHATHYHNFRQATDGHPDIAPTWLPIPFEVSGHERFIPLLRSNWSVRASWRARRALDRVRAAGPLNAVFFHTQVTALFSIGVMRQVPAVISLDATPINYDSVGEYYQHRPPGDGFVDRQKYQLNRRAFHAAAGLVTWSEWARRSLIDDYGVDGDRVKVVPPGAPPLYFELGDARGKTDGRPRERLRLLFVGGDFERKGGPLLLELMRGPLGERTHLDIVTQADVAARPNVDVHRNVKPNSPTLRRLFEEADVFVLPTYADCLAVVLEEAAAAGLPVITTRVGAVDESVDEGKSGILIGPGDGRALAQAITALADNPARRIQMGRAASALAHRKFRAAINDRVILDFLWQLADARQPLAA